MSVALRNWVYKTLTQNASVKALIGGSDPRVFAKKSMTSLKEDHPYVVYKLGNDVSFELSEERSPSNQYIQIWVHDYQSQEVADYSLVDQVIDAIKAALLNTALPKSAWTITWIETSQDLDDDTLNTVFRYMRFRVVKE